MKGVGEVGAIGVPPAVINAVLDALHPLGVTDIYDARHAREGVARDPGREGRRPVCKEGGLMMKPFELHRPASAKEAIDLAPRARWRQAPRRRPEPPAACSSSSSPSRAISISLARLAELKKIAVATGMRDDRRARHARRRQPLRRRRERAIPALAKLAGAIGDAQVRNRGTLGGSVAHADPAADYPAALVALGATIVTDRREIAADSFFTGLFETALEPRRAR